MRSSAEYKNVTICFLIILISFFSNLILINKTYSQNGPLKDRFYIAYHNYLYSSSYRTTVQFGNYSDLGINMMQSYGSSKDIDLTHHDGGFKDPAGSYDYIVGGYITEWGQTSGTRGLIIEREKIKRGAYGQQSDYQAEMTNPQNYRPGYGYENTSGQTYTETWQGESVSGRQMCINCPETNPAGYIVKDLFENREQVDRNKPITPVNPDNGWNSAYYFSDVKTPGYNWFIMPRMRINTSDANIIPPKKVVTIEVIAFDGSLKKSIDIFTDNFKNNGQYNGEYRESYYNQLTGNPLDLFLTGSDINSGNTTYDAMGRSVNMEESQVDYRVYWWGDVDVWLDRVRVQDEWAHFLFYPDLEQAPRQYDFKAKLEEEINDSCIGGNQYFGYTYSDEFEFNTLPCIAKVNEYIKQVNSNCGHVVEVNTSLIRNYSGLRNPPTYEELFEYFYTSNAIKDILFMYQYPFGHIKTQSSPDTYTILPLPPGLPLPSEHSPGQYPATENFGIGTGYHRAGGGN